MTLADFIAELRLCGPWELRGPQRMLRTAGDRGDCPLAAVTRLTLPQANVNRILKQRTENPIHVMGRRLGLTAREAEIIADAADGLDAMSAASEGVDFERAMGVRAAMLEACGLGDGNGAAGEAMTAKSIRVVVNGRYSYDSPTLLRVGDRVQLPTPS